jgi:peroxiredoxin
MLLPGDPAPHFSVASSVNPDFHLDAAAGRHVVVLCFFASSTIDFSARVLEQVSRRTDRFNVSDAVFFGLSVDPEDRTRLAPPSPGIAVTWRADRRSGPARPAPRTGTNRTRTTEVH